ncbi:MAG: prepilin-type N-terminal cleavage/methylation domain-containing protein [Opitutae bacterium]|jgi:prepilin-type N-terminal cleavage/methylation domain-containing protein|nr:prepilin-type N-terminal cleavage/methylation domain-containing protein [Opitutae bacterium]
MNNRRYSKAGFTLVELLVVIVIIGILAGITFTGANYLLGAQDEKQAKSHIAAISLALDQYKSEMGGYPRTDSISNEEDIFKCGEFLLFTLNGILDRDGKSLAIDDRRKSFIPGDALVFGKQDGKRNEVFSPSESDWQTKSRDPFFAMDPWNEPYIYQFPRKDGHKGFLLFSKGPNGRASVFNQELTSTPPKEIIDEDNIPASEPGKW